MNEYLQPVEEAQDPNDIFKLTETKGYSAESRILLLKQLEKQAQTALDSKRQEYRRYTKLLDEEEEKLIDDKSELERNNRLDEISIQDSKRKITRAIKKKEKEKDLNKQAIEQINEVKIELENVIKEIELLKERKKKYVNYTQFIELLASQDETTHDSSSTMNVSRDMEFQDVSDVFKRYETLSMIQIDLLEQQQDLQAKIDKLRKATRETSQYIEQMTLQNNSKVSILMSQLENLRIQNLQAEQDSVSLLIQNTNQVSNQGKVSFAVKNLLDRASMKRQYIDLLNRKDMNQEAQTFQKSLILGTEDVDILNNLNMVEKEILFLKDIYFLGKDLENGTKVF
eukprot:TRINITY_DN9433_c0_g1_i1.p1 TRINITY_DN9433_c0_g1~~TRINITY_DN9433_c0_g1_i1.p1  ORF type:complete len:341 (+),score=114.50 TRINITY_DN9433_c0_g1_i1:38-1060(+)